MAGIYIHIPFCKQACHYCNFHFSTNNSTIVQMVQAIQREAELQKNYLTEKVDTIYFGGGTPSLLPAEDLKLLIEKLQTIFVVQNDAEITIETNPDDISEQQLLTWKKIGINRLSIGVQTFNDQELQWMNRAHNATQALESLSIAVQQFSNITIDLIYGSPLLTDEQWLHNIQTAINLSIPHLSCYALTVEPKTALYQKIITKKEVDVDTDKQARQFEILLQVTAAAGYEHYEISNLAKNGFRSKHNSSYWQGKPYLGLGPSAHSFNGYSRQWNVANNALYIQSIQNNIIPGEEEMLTKTQQLNEYIMTALRTSEGILLDKVNDSLIQKERLMKVAKKWESSGHLSINESHIQLTAKGKFMADGIAADLFVD